MFVDCDFVFTGDILEMFEGIETQKISSKGSHPVYVTQHDYKPVSSTKMDGVDQTPYNMKLWAALMVFDMDNAENRKLTPLVVNSRGGRELMNFCWTTDPALNLGVIPEEWHFIPNHSEGRIKDIKGIHWTEGGPYFKNYRGGAHDHLFWDAFRSYVYSHVDKFDFDIERLVDGD
jgi:hypothetical protein